MRRIVTRNRKARYTYDVLEELECGVVLTGSEVKSIRDGKISINESFARVVDGELCFSAEAVLGVGVAPGRMGA